ncbi:MAG: ABC transporter substrate-binding protein [Puniceicoccales bacterium]|jgi:ABC-type Fe3+ transport system substrate-binding protein|nr:ABC transporter substrate-binding protein [Puniceicoccales bacterium]
MVSAEKIKKFFLFGGLACIAIMPFLVRSGGSAINANTDDTVVILTGHNENLRFEFSQGFQKWYRERTGRTVFVDWRYLGGVSEIVRYLDSVYGSAFRQYWEKDLGRPWTAEVQKAFVQRSADESKWGSGIEREVCEAFYNSKITSAIDILFGGGVSEFIVQANRGAIVDSGFLGEHPELFCDGCIPHFVGAEELWDGNGRWFGQSLSTFGILRNRAALAALGLEDGDVAQWEQLADPRLFGAVALVDPTKSSALLKAYEMIVQQQIFFRRKELEAAGDRRSSWKNDGQAAREGWMRGLRLLQRIAGNTRYFSDAPSKMVQDVASGNSAVGIIVDFIGNGQAAFDRSRCGWERLNFILPVNGSAISPDPIAILRGAPNESVAKLFLEYILGEEGQKVIAFRIGTPGGPIRNELYRPPVNVNVYADCYAAYRTSCDNQMDAIAHAALSVDASATAHLYNTLKWIVKFALMVPQKELVEAWSAILTARREGRFANAEKAMEIMEDFSGFAYDEANETLAAVLQPSQPSLSLATQRKIVERFKRQYELAKHVAESGRQMH